MATDTTLMDGFVAPRPRVRPRLHRRSLQAAGDARLVDQIRGGDGPAARASFEVLYDRHHRGILAFCRHMLGSAEDAEDAVQHTFSAAYRALLRDDREIALRAWLYAIARNRCLSMLAARREQVALDDVEAVLPSALGLSAEVEQRSDLRDLLGDLQRLPEDQRAALVLAELEAHSHKEIAAILEVPQSKVKALVFQARETLMIHRLAREADCGQIQEQLSVLRGGALRRRELRRHVEGCPGCTAFEAEVRRQRAGMALLLPVAPTFALKHSTLASAFAAGTTGAAAGIGAIAGGGGVAGGIALGTQAIGTKVLATLAVAGGAGGGGYVAVQEVRHQPPPARTAAPAPAAKPARVTPAAAVASPVMSPKAVTTKSEDRAEGRKRGSRDRDRDRDRDRARGRDGRDGAGPPSGRPDTRDGARGQGRADRQDGPRRGAAADRPGRAGGPSRRGRPDRAGAGAGAGSARSDRAAAKTDRASARADRREAQRRARADRRAREAREAARQQRGDRGRDRSAAPLAAPVTVPPAAAPARPDRTRSGSGGPG